MRTLLWFCLSAILIMPTLSWGRWLWVPGEHQGKKGCTQSIQQIQRRLSTVLNERLQVNLKIDGQILSCQTVECVRLRMTASDALVGVLTQSQCLKNALEIEVIIVPKKGQERTYKSRLSQNKEKQFSKEHALLSGVKLARKIIKGPAPYPLKATQSTSGWSIALGWSSHTLNQASGAGSFLQVQWRYTPLHSSYEGGLVLSRNQNQSAVWSDLIWSIGLQGRRYLSRKGLAPFFGAGLNVSVLNAESYKYIETNDHAFLRASYFKREFHQDFGIEPVVEMGLLWWGKTLNPYLSLLFKPIWLTGSNLNLQRLHIVGGVQW